MVKKKLTPVQEVLLLTLSKYISTEKALPYNNLKNLCEFKSFDGTFNALLFKGYVVSVPTNDNSNMFKLA